MNMPPAWFVYKYPTNGYRPQPSTHQQTALPVESVTWPVFLFIGIIMIPLIWGQLAFLSYRFDLSWICMVTPIVVGNIIYMALGLWILHRWV